MIQFSKRIARRYLAARRERARRRQWQENSIYIAPGSRIHPSTTIGKCTRINATSDLGECSVGAYCAIGGRLVVRSQNHHSCYLNMQDWAQREVIQSDVSVTGKKSANVKIGNAVWMGDSVIVLPGVSIGDGAIVGAGSVVTKSIPPYSIAVGNPARVIRQRFADEIIERLRKIHWWEWSPETLRANRKLFELDLETVEPHDLQALIDRLEVNSND